jgi:dienelactone hydrolase
MINETEIEFASEGAVLRGRLVLPSSNAVGKPAVIMAHGTSATVEMVLIEYARAFARAGIVAMVYVHRNFGRSGGEPRGEINPWVQCRGYLSALDFACDRPEIDANRIALWGDSYTGGQVVAVAACDPRPCAVVAQCPVFGMALPTVQPSDDNISAFKQTLLHGDVTGTQETTTGPLPVVSFDPTSISSLLEPIQTFRWFIEYGGRPGSGWKNRVTRVLPPTPAPYTPLLCAAYVRVPTLLMVAPEDEMVHANPEVSRHAYSLIPADKRWVDVKDGHFGLIHYPSERFNEVAGIQAAFLQKNLLKSDRLF